MSFVLAPMAQSIEAGLAGHTDVPAARLIRSWSQKTSTIKQIDTPRRPRKRGWLGMLKAVHALEQNQRWLPSRQPAIA